MGKQNNTTVMNALTEDSFSSERLLQQAVQGLLRRMGFTGVQILQGALEYGKDVVFWDKGPLGERIACACVVKNGRISGSVDKSSSARVVFNQAEQALDTPYVDSEGTEVFIARVYVISPAPISQSALMSIKGKFRQRNGQVCFLCGSDFFALLQEHWPDYLADEASLIDKYLQSQKHELIAGDPLRVAAEDLGIDDASPAEKKIYVLPSFHRTLTLYRLAPLPDPLVLNGRSLSDRWTCRDFGAVLHFHKTLVGLLALFERWDLVQLPREEAVDSRPVDLEPLLSSFLGDLLISWHRRCLEQPGTVPDISVFREYITSLADDFASRVERAPESTDRKSMGFPPHVLRLFDHLKANVAHESRLGEFDTRFRNIENIVQSRLQPIRDALSLDAMQSSSVRSGVDILSTPAFLSTSRLSDALVSDPVNSLVPDRTVTFDFHKELLGRWTGSVLIAGGPGSGKTAFCRWNALRDAEEFNTGKSERIPVYVPLHRLAHGKLESFSQAFLSAYGRSGLIERKAATDDPQYPLSLYLDGLDEIPSVEQRRRLVDLAKDGMTEHTGLRVVMTVRDYVIEPWLGWLPRVSLSRLDENEVRDLAKQWFEGCREKTEGFFRDLGRHSTLTELVGVPLLANLLILVYRKNQQLPRNRTHLYKTFVDLLSGGWDLAKNVVRETRFGTEVKQTILCMLASELHTSGVRRCDRNRFGGVVQQSMPRLQVTQEALIEELVRDGLLSIEGNELHYRHQSFQEYFAACDLIRDVEAGRVKRVIGDYLRGKDWWREVIHFYIELSGKPRDLVRWLFFDDEMKHFSTGSRFPELIRMIDAAYPEAHVYTQVPPQARE